jgi:predicted dehydrogenase
MFTRRRFLQSSSLATAGLLAGCQSAPKRRPISPNEKLNVGIIGVAGRGAENIEGLLGENIVALCDVNSNNVAKASARFPSARAYTDWRRFLEQPDLDAVLVSTPDHTHAVIAAQVLESGRPLYLEKPVTHNVQEARILAKLVTQSGLPTQTGNQIHSGNNYRRVVELIQSGAIGPVHEVHHWAGSIWETKPFPTPQPAPSHLNYELWVGPVAYQPYSTEWVPFNWRRWWHWGGGTLTDFCCHHMDLGVWALGLQLPTVIEAEGPKPDEWCAPPWLKVRYEFPARPGMDRPTVMHWYSGTPRPQVPGTPDLTKWGGGTLFVGSKGMLLADYSRYLLLPEEKFRDFPAPPQTIPNSIGHHAEWIEACKGRGQTHSPLTYGALLTEIGALGNVAYRTGKRIEWDAKNLRAKGVPEADRYIQYHYRPGWKLT